MFKRLLILILAVVLLTVGAFAQVEEIKSIGDKAFISGSLDSAIIQYESILGQEYVSAEVHFNLGNAYFRTGNIPNAILNYERALKLAPSDEDIQFNLRLAKLRTVDKIEAVPELWFVTKWNSLYQILHVDQWAWLVVLIACFLVGCIILFVTATNPFIKKNGFFGSIVFGVFLLLSVYLAQTSFNHLTNDNRAVVMQPSLTVKSSPDKSGNDLFVVHEGLVVEEEDQTGDWKRIKLPDGNTGWVPSKSLEEI
ncbi:MAG: hypothetical protein ACI9FU_002020 [Granulosicoccus sp.]|jgi:hypothetical protein